MFNTIKFICLIFFLQAGFITYGQVVPTPATDTVREFEIIRGPSMRALKIDSVTTLQTIAGGAIVKQGTTIFHGDSLVINPTTHVIEAFGNIEINQADSLHTYAQYLKYLGQEKIAHLTNNVKLDGPKNHVRADSLLYNMQTKQSTFISETNIKNDEVEINTRQGTYDLNTGNAFFTSRTTVKDSSGRFYTANNMALENKSGNAQLEGDAVIIDSANGFIVSGNQIFLNKKNNSFLATRKPVLIIKQKNDSTYIAADTIYSGFTTFVKNQNITLKKDSVINVSLPENEKIHGIETGDSLYKKFSQQSKPIEDSIKIISSKKDSLQLKSKDIRRLPIEKETGPPLKDSVTDRALPKNKKIPVMQVEDDTSVKNLPLKQKLFIDSGKIIS